MKSVLAGRRCFRSRSGVSRSDVVALFVIGLLLFSLASPALSQFSFFGKRTACMNNMRSIALALHNHESATRRIPLMTTTAAPLDQVAPGSIGEGDTPEAGYSFHTMLLPFGEEQELYNWLKKVSDKFAISPYNDKVNSVGAEPTHFATHQVPALRCPELGEVKVVETSFETEIDGKPTTVETEYAALKLAGGAPAASSYVGFAGTHVDAEKGLLENGIMVSPCYEKKEDKCVGKGYTFANVRDGTSLTLLFTETREPSYAAWIDGQANWVVGIDASQKIEGVGTPDATATAHTLGLGPNAKKKELTPIYSTQAMLGKKGWPGSTPRRFGPSSRHTSVVNHVFVDGHAQAIAKEIDPHVYFRMITINGGERLVSP